MRQFFAMTLIMNTHAHHTHAHAQYDRAFVIGVVLNAAFIAIEVAAGLMADSLALLADAGHNASDVAGLLLAWGATWLARRQASERFTYGLQSASILAALANGLLLMLAVGGIMLEALQRFDAPEAPAAPVVIAVALIGVAINGFTAWLFHGGSHDLNIRGAFLHMAGDAAVSLGVAAAGALILYTGWLWLDPLVSLLISAAIIVGTWQLLTGAVSMSLHAVPATIRTEEVRLWLSQQEGVNEVHDLHIWAMSTTDVALTAHLIIQGGHPGDAFLHTVTHALEERFHIGHATLQIEIGDGTACHAGCE